MLSNQYLNNNLMKSFSIINSDTLTKKTYKNISALGDL